MAAGGYTFRKQQRTKAGAATIVNACQTEKKADVLK